MKKLVLFLALNLVLFVLSAGPAVSFYGPVPTASIGYEFSMENDLGLSPALFLGYSIGLREEVWLYGPSLEVGLKLEVDNLVFKVSEQVVYALFPTILYTQAGLGYKLSRLSLMINLLWDNKTSFIGGLSLCVDY